MLTNRHSVLPCGIAPTRRALFLVMMMLGMIVAATHSDAIGSAQADGRAVQTLVVDPAQAAEPLMITEAVPARPCPAQASCHGVMLFTTTAEMAATPSRGGFWRLVPGQTRAVGRRLGQDHPPPIA